jgi:FkbM family methyltransferase
MESTLTNILRPIRDVALAVATYPCGVRRTVNGRILRVDARTRSSFSGTYDTGVTQLLRDMLKPGDECWNIGAHVGVHVLQMCSLIGPSGRVFAFEPNPRAAALLRRNVTFNGFSDRVSIIPTAVGERSGTTDFHFAGSDPMARAERPNPLLRRTRCIRVPLLTLDQFLVERGCSPRCIVIDIEGWEIGALVGAHEVLRLRPLPLLIVELHPDAWSWSGHSREQLEQLMASHGLEALALSGQADVLGEHGQALIRCAEVSDL